jgi:hypothetical protein
MARIKQALLQHGPCEAASAPLLSATAELPFCQDGSFPFRARHPRRLCSCESKSKNQAAHRVRKVRQVVGNGGSVRVLFAVAVAWLCAPMSAGSSGQYQTPATPRVVIREPGTFAGSGGVLCLRGRACETRPCRPLPRATATAKRTRTSGKNSWYFHTLGYETIFLQKSNFFHTQKVLFHTLENCFIPSKKWKLFSYPYTKVSYLENFFHTLIQKFHTLSKYFSYPQKPISYPNL